jgi:hypothetical protein
MENPVGTSCYYLFAYQVAVGGLPAVMFGDGLILLIILSLFVRIPIEPYDKTVLA